MTAFVDTFALIAWLNASDAAHAEVTTYLNAHRGRLLTTEWVLIELVDAMSSPDARAAVVPFLQAIRQDPNIDIVGYDMAVYQAGFDLFTTRPDKDWSLTDCVSFSVMTNRGIPDALTQDQHFVQAGFRAVFKK